MYRLPSLLKTWFFISGRGTVLGVLRALNNFATTKINFAELFACEVTFLHMSVNCKEEKLTLSRRKAIFMGSILEKKFCSYSCFQFLKSVKPIIIFFYLLSRDKCISHYFVAQFLKIAINMIETTSREEKNLPSKQPKQILKEFMYSIKKIL